MRPALVQAFLLGAIVPLATGFDDGPTNIRDILLPSRWPETEYTTSCSHLDFREFFMPPPLPTGSISTAFHSYGGIYKQECYSTWSGSPEDAPWACSPDDEWVCGFPTASPQFSSAYLDIASTAASWWAEHSSAALHYAQACPEIWYHDLWSVAGGAFDLNTTISHARCWEQLSGRSHTTTGMTPSASLPSETASAASPGGSGEDDSGATSTPGPDSAAVSLQKHQLYGGTWGTAAAAGAVAFAVAQAAF